MVSLLELLISPFPKRKESEEVSADEIEKCNLCGVDTPYTFSTHIDERECYTPGSGQQCESCYYQADMRKIPSIPEDYQ